MGTLLDKVNKMGAGSVTPEEFKETWGVTQETEVNSMMKFIKRQRFEAKVVEGKERCMRVLAKLREVLAQGTETAARLTDLLTVRYPAMQFRNLDELTEEQKEQIAEDVELLRLLDEEDESSSREELKDNR